MFSIGVSAWMLCAVQKMKPPPGARVWRRSRTSARTSSGVPKGSVFWIEIEPWKRETVAEPPLEFAAIHVGHVRLDRVEDVQAAIDQVGNDRLDGAAAMVGHLVAEALGQVDEGLETGAKELAATSGAS